MLSTWIKSITGHNSLAYFQSKLNPEIDPTCRLCLQANETLHHLMTDCEATTSLQMDTMIYDRFAKININTDSFDDKPLHVQKAETVIYTVI